MINLAIIGSGPTAIYTAKYLIAQNCVDSLTMFESQAEAGKGTPYHQDWNSESMLSNIASIEIPPVTETLVEWMQSQDDFELAEIGLTRDDIDERKFYPRVVLGEYFYDQLQKLITLAQKKKIKMVINTRSHVEDVAVIGKRIRLSVRSTITEAINYAEFSHVVMATGHVWPKESEIRPGYFISPWPPTALSTIGECHVGILGTSLSAIDAMVALATARGVFWQSENGLQYLPEPGTENFKITLMSRKGLLPEADFYHPVPYTPLKICTPERIDDLINRESNQGLLDAAFELFKEELAAAAPKYAARKNLHDLTLEQFCKVYFHEREEHDPFEWAELNLAEAKANAEKKFTVAWRYAILRMHEVIGRIVRHLSAEDFKRFGQFKQIFVDDYATVPHESIERVLAMHKAGKLEILGIGSDYQLDKETPERGAILTYDDKVIHFPAFIEATGQRGLSVKDFPFPSLWEQGIIKNATTPYGEEMKKRPLKIGGIELDMAYHPVSDSPEAYRLYCPSIPFMLGQFPFAQGITSSHDIGKVIAEDLAEDYSETQPLKKVGGM